MPISWKEIVDFGFVKQDIWIFLSNSYAALPETIIAALPWSSYSQRYKQ